MASFEASIDLTVRSNKVERQLKKVERNLNRIEDASNDILSVDKKIVAARRELIGLTGEQAVNAKKRLSDLRLQRTELSLQKRELQAINTLERRRAQALANTTSGGDGGGNIGGNIGGAQAVSSFALLDALNPASKRATEVAEAAKKIRDQLDADPANLEKSAKIIQKIEAGNRKIVDQQEKIAARSKEINKADEKRAAVQRRINILQGQLNAGVIKNKDKVKDAKKELVKLKIDAKEYTGQIGRANKAITLHQRFLRDARTAFKGINKEADDYDNQLDKIAKRRASRIGAGKAAAAGAAFAEIPGQDLLQAGAAGALIAGPKGAAIAAAVAGTLKLGNALAAFGKQSAIARAEFDKLLVSLEAVAGSDFERAFKTATRITEDFNTPLNDSVANLTKLVAAGNSVGLEFKDVDTIIRGLSASNKALGGDQEKLNGTLNAAIQILSKGKVQAEELRGQIGDRLPGAFGRFADALKITTAELDQRLKDGKVTVADFVTFTQSELDKYEQAAKTIADSPAEAGERLKTALKNLNLAVGPLTASIGAKFQDLGTVIVNGLTEGAKAIEDLQRNALQAQLKIEQGLNKNIRKRLIEVAGIGQTEAKPQSDPQVQALQARLAASDQRIKDIERTLQPLLAQDGFIGPPAPTTPTTGNGNGNTPDPDAAARAAAAEKRLRTAQQAVFTQKELNRLAEDLVRAEIRGDQATAARLRGVRDEVAIQNRLKAALENETDARVRAAFEQRAALEIDEIRIRVGGELARIQADSAEAARKANEERIRQLQEQRRLLLDAAGLVETIAGTVANTGGNPLKSVTDQVRTLQNQAKFGKNADLVGQLEDLVLNQGVPFNEAFNAVEQLRQQRELNAATQEYQNLLNGIGGTVTDGLVRGLTAAVTETDRLGEAFKDLGAQILEAIGQALILAAVRGAINAAAGNDGVGFFSILKGGFSGRAAGGPVDANRPYVVGEKGPELFVPDRSGDIINNDDSRAFAEAASALTQPGTSSDEPAAFSDEAEVAFATGRAALRGNTERLEQKESASFFKETMVQASESKPMNIRFDSRVINNVEYVTADQFKEGLTTTAKEARAQVFADMKNKPSVRRSLGM